MNLMLLWPILLPVLGGLCAAFIPGMQERRVRTPFVGLILALTVLAVAPILVSAEPQLTLWQLTDTISITLRADGMAKLFIGLVSVMWLLVGIFSFEYMHHEKNEPRFYAFYLLSLGDLMALGMSGNLVTLYMFYEGMTLLTLPLVLHSQTKEAVAAGIKYLIYSVFGASAALLGIFFLNHYCTTLTFTPGGALDMAKVAGNEPLLLGVILLMIVGFGTKTGMFPLHGWLPTAHPVAPAPASAVLSGVITKGGVLGIVRVVFFLVGPAFLRGTFVQTAWMTLALITVFMGSMLAFKENVLKKRLAYSTVSQVSYVLFGLSTLTPVGFLGALLHIVAHSVIKDTLFLSAGAVIYKTGKTRVDELTGIGKQMPVTMWCFTLVSVALIGIPPTCGFVSKWYLAQGALALGASVFAWFGPAVLLTSALLTAGYLMPIAIRGFFPGNAVDLGALEKKEPTAYMLAPLLLLAAAAVLIGMFPGALLSFFQSIAGSVF